MSLQWASFLVAHPELDDLTRLPFKWCASDDEIVWALTKALEAQASRHAPSGVLSVSANDVGMFLFGPPGGFTSEAARAFVRVSSARTWVAKRLIRLSREGRVRRLRPLSKYSTHTLYTLPGAKLGAFEIKHYVDA